MPWAAAIALCIAATDQFAWSTSLPMPFILSCLEMLQTVRKGCFGAAVLSKGAPLTSSCLDLLQAGLGASSEHKLSLWLLISKS